MRLVCLLATLHSGGWWAVPRLWSLLGPVPPSFLGSSQCMRSGEILPAACSAFVHLAALVPHRPPPLPLPVAVLALVLLAAGVGVAASAAHDLARAPLPPLHVAVHVLERTRPLLDVRPPLAVVLRAIDGPATDTAVTWTMQRYETVGHLHGAHRSTPRPSRWSYTHCPSYEAPLGSVYLPYEEGRREEEA